MFIYQIEIQKPEDAEAFVTFMREEYIPAVEKQQAGGRVTGVMLLQGGNMGTSHMFFLHIRADHHPTVPRVHDQELQHKFDSFGASVKNMGDWIPVVPWPEDRPA